MKTKFEQDLVSAISEKDKAQTELKEAQKKNELLERAVREERESNSLLQDEKNKFQVPIDKHGL
jgi:hypothetical protein